MVQQVSLDFAKLLCNTGFASNGVNLYPDLDKRLSAMVALGNRGVGVWVVLLAFSGGWGEGRVKCPAVSL